MSPLPEPHDRDDVPVEANLTDLGQFLRKRRHELGMRMDALAEAVNRSVAAISKIERGEQQLDLPLFFRLAAALNVEPHVALWEIKRKEFIEAGDTEYVKKVDKLLRPKSQ